MRKYYIYLSFISCFFIHQQLSAQVYDLEFQILNQVDNSPVENVQIIITPCACGGVTDVLGKFSIKLPSDNYIVQLSYLGFKTITKEISLNANEQLTLYLIEEEEQLSEVVLNAKQVIDRLETPQMGALQMTVAELKKMPAAVGEVDLLRSLTLLPGVNNAGEVSNGLSVRGGSLDQNLLLYDYAPVFNPTHLFGLFTVFTPEAIISSDLYRANIPARYGGRVTSVLDVKVRRPFTDKFKMEGGIGLVSSRLSIETPIVKEKLFIYAGARGSFTDFLLPIFSKRLDKTKARFFDHTIKLLYLPTEKDQISLTNFFSKDFYQLDLISQVENVNAETNQYDFRTFNNTLDWVHSFNEDTSLRTIVLYSDYVPKTLFPEQANNNVIEYESQINYLSAFSELDKKVNESLSYYVGIQGNQYTIKPGMLDPGNGNSINPVNLEKETSYELSAYTNINWSPIQQLTISAGLRFNNFTFVGPHTMVEFDDVTEEILNITEYEKGEKVKDYNHLEPRLGVNLRVAENTSFKISYARLNQYLQNIYNSATPLPTSRWKTSDALIAPQQSDAYSIGVYQNLDENNLELSVEGYYRKTKNNLTYVPGADFFLEPYLDQLVAQAAGKAYGIEFNLRKPKGKFNGWLNYTWSRSFLKTDSNNLNEQINNNQWFRSDFDRPHVFNGTLAYEGDKYNTWSFNFTAQSGRPYSIANGYVRIEDIEIPLFLERNNARLKTYHRLDFSWKVKYSKKLNRRWVGDWTFTVYNLYSRKNQYNVYYTQRVDGESFANSSLFFGSPLGSYELNIMNSPLFALTYNFVFD